MVAKNDITGHEIKTKILSSEGRDNYDRIFRKDKMRNRQINLFLDDVRTPREAALWGETPIIGLLEKSKIPEGEWDIVRSYEEFVKFIQANGIPDVVSFDNDLWDVTSSTATNDQLVKQFQMLGWQEFEIKTGAHCAQYLVDACRAYNRSIPTYYIHTANSAARPIIKEILENARNNSQ